MSLDAAPGNLGHVITQAPHEGITAGLSVLPGSPDVGRTTSGEPVIPTVGQQQANICFDAGRCSWHLAEGLLDVVQGLPHCFRRHVICMPFGTVPAYAAVLGLLLLLLALGHRKGRANKHKRRGALHAGITFL